MYDIADRRSELSAEARVVRIVALSGFGSRRAGDAAVVDAHGHVRVGSILSGLADGAIAAALADGARVGTIEVTVSDPDAEAGGMACGGAATLVVQRIDSIPDTAWDALRRRHPVAMLTALVDTTTTAVTDEDVATETTDGAEARARALLRSGQSAADVVDGVLVESFLPPSTVRIVGHAGVGVALAAQAELLGWHHETVDGVEDAVTAAQAQRAHDALVVLSHDEAIDTAALAVALDHGRGYVGALGSRGTQAARRDRLAALGFDATTISTVHGPVGLDLGSRTPAETAVAIVAEIIAFRSGRRAASLATSDGPING